MKRLCLAILLLGVWILAGGDHVLAGKAKGFSGRSRFSPAQQAVFVGEPKPASSSNPAGVAAANWQWGDRGFQGGSTIGLPQTYPGYNQNWSIYPPPYPSSYPTYVPYPYTYSYPFAHSAVVVPALTFGIYGLAPVPGRCPEFGFGPGYFGVPVPVMIRTN